MHVFVIHMLTAHHISENDTFTKFSLAILCDCFEMTGQKLVKTCGDQFMFTCIAHFHGFPWAK